MLKTSSFIFAAPAQYEQEAAKLQHPLGIMAYGFDQRSRLIRNWQCQNSAGNYMVISYDCSRTLTFDPHVFLTQLLREYSTKCYSGVIMDFEGEPSASAAELLSFVADQLSQRGIPLYLPENFSGCLARNTGIIISSAISGGNLEQRLRQAAHRFGKEHILLELERNCEDFTLPAPTGCGIRLTPSQLDEMFLKLLPAPFFSKDLCTYYFSYKDTEGKCHFVLFDNGVSIRRKILTAEKCGISNFLLLYPEVSGICDDIFKSS